MLRLRFVPWKKSIERSESKRNLEVEYAKPAILRYQVCPTAWKDCERGLSEDATARGTEGYHVELDYVAVHIIGSAEIVSAARTEISAT